MEMQKKSSKVLSNVCPWAGYEKYWLKAFLLHSQKQRLGLESHELSVKSVFPLSAKVITDNGALIDDRSEAEGNFALATLYLT